MRLHTNRQFEVQYYDHGHFDILKIGDPLNDSLIRRQIPEPWLLHCKSVIWNKKS